MANASENGYKFHSLHMRLAAEAWLEPDDIPSGFKLRLLTEDLQPFNHNEDTAIEPVAQLYVDVILESREGLVWEIEPMPEGYDREILNF